MLTLPLVAAFLVGMSLTLDENEWSDSVVEVLGKYTTYLNRKDGIKYRDMFTDDSEMLHPGIPMARKEGIWMSELKVYDAFHVEHRYVDFVELMFTSPDMAVVRHLAFSKTRDGNVKRSNGAEKYRFKKTLGMIRQGQVGGRCMQEIQEWRDEIVRIYGMFTKYSNANQPAKIADLFTEDGEGLYPDTGVVGKDGLVLTEKQYHQERNFGDVYIGMAELLYTSPNVGVARHMAYDSNGPGHKGIMIFLADEDGVRIKMAIFNHN